MFKALHEVVSKAGGNMSEASRQSILGLIDDDANNSDGKNSTSPVSRFSFLVDSNGLQML